MLVLCDEPERVVATHQAPGLCPYCGGGRRERAAALLRPALLPHPPPLLLLPLLPPPRLRRLIDRGRPSFARVLCSRTME